MKHTDRVSRHEDKERIERRGAADHQAKADQSTLAMGAPKVGQGKMLGRALARGAKGRRLLEFEAHVVANRADDEAEQEGHAPSPRFELIGHERARRDGSGETRQKNRDPLAGELPSAVKATAVRRSLLDEKCRGGRELA